MVIIIHINNEFYKFNDSMVNKTHISEIFNHQTGGRHPYRNTFMDHSAYLLFYKLIEPKSKTSEQKLLQETNLSSLSDTHKNDLE